MTLNSVVIPAVQTPEPTLQEQLDALDAANAAPLETDDNGDANEPRPEWLPAKFKSPEDMAKSYNELERKLGAPKAEVPTENPVPNAGDAEADQARNAGVDVDALTDKFIAQGSLEDSDYAALEAAGWDRGIVDNYIRGQQAVAQQFEAQAHALVGGPDEYAALTQWAAESLTADEIAVFNDAVATSDAAATSAIRGLAARYAQDQDREPSRRLNGGSGNASGGAGYESLAQMQADMRNPKYQTDPAFRAKVEQKLAVSTII